jgi:hypothetical protein
MPPERWLKKSGILGGLGSPTSDRCSLGRLAVVLAQRKPQLVGLAPCNLQAA